MHSRVRRRVLQARPCARTKQNHTRVPTAPTFTRPLRFLATFSYVGANCLQWPHLSSCALHGACQMEASQAHARASPTAGARPWTPPAQPGAADPIAQHTMHTARNKQASPLTMARKIRRASRRRRSPSPRRQTSARARVHPRQSHAPCTRAAEIVRHCPRALHHEVAGAHTRTALRQRTGRHPAAGSTG